MVHGKQVFQSPQLSSRKQPKNTTAYENGITNACTGTGFTLRSKPARNAGVMRNGSAFARRAARPDARPDGDKSGLHGRTGPLILSDDG